MFAFTVRRLIQMLVVLWAVSVIVFLMMTFTGDPVFMVVPIDATQAEIAQARHILGLDRSMFVQYGIFLSGLLQGDFGLSYVFRQPAFDLIVERLPATIEMVAVAPVIATVQARRMVDEVVLSGCTWIQARTARRLEPQLHVLMNVDGHLRTLLSLCSARLALLISWLQARHARVAGLHIGHHMAADRFIRNASKRNLPIWTWTVDDPSRALQLVTLGAISVTSNWPDRILAVL